MRLHRQTGKPGSDFCTGVLAHVELGARNRHVCSVAASPKSLMTDIFQHLNRSDTWLGLDEGEGAGDLPRQRVLAQLGDYIAAIIKPLNMRPRTTTLLYDSPQRIEVRVSTDEIHVLVVIAPEGDLAGELFFMRMLSGRHLPIPRLITADLSCGFIPFSYIVQGHIAGVPLATVDDSALVRVAARQIGRVLRQAHNLPAPGFGKPTPAGRWTSRAWAAILGDWLTRRGSRSLAGEALGESLAEALWAATLDHPATDWHEPRIIHGAVSPKRALVTTGSAAHLEALVRPGEIVGGDPLFDLALATLPRHPAAFQQGVYEGYCGAGTLSIAQHQRLQRLRLLLHTADVVERNELAALELLPATLEAALAELKG